MYNFTREQLIDYWVDVLGYTEADTLTTEELSSRLSDYEIKDCALYNNKSFYKVSEV